MKNLIICFTALLLSTTNSSAQCISAVQLDGTNQYLHTPFNNYTFTNFTLEMWVNSQSFSGNVHYISLFQNAYLVLGDWVPETFSTWADGLNPISFNSGNVGSINTWHHVAFVYDGTNSILYLDGVAVATQPTTGSVTHSTTSFDGGLVIGARYDQMQQYVTAIFDDVRIWNIARSQSELQNAMNVTLSGNEAGLVAYYTFQDGIGSTTASDLTGNGNTLTLYNMDPNTDWVAGNASLSAVQGTDTRTECSPYQWIDGNIYTADNSVATYLMPGAAVGGCDSLVTLDLTITNVSDISTSTSGITITANNATASYRWLDCDNNYAVIGGATSSSYTPIANGNYAVELTENNCVDTSACVAINSVGIIENDFGYGLQVFPNPSKGKFTIDFGSIEEEVTMIVTDINGRTMQQNKLVNIKLTDLIIDEAPGVYFLSIRTENKEALIKLIKE